MEVTVEQFQKEMSEIEKIQKEVDWILYNKNPFIRLFWFNKGKKLHETAHDRMIKLFSCEITVPS